MTLTPRQKKFAELYVGNGNAKQSAIEAGYSESVATKQSSLLTKNKDIQEYILLLTSKIYANHVLTAKERLSVLCRFIDDEHVKVADRIKAIDLLNKMTGYYFEKSEPLNDSFTGLTTEELRKIIAEDIDTDN